MAISKLAVHDEALQAAHRVGISSGSPRTCHDLRNLLVETRTLRALP